MQLKNTIENPPILSGVGTVTGFKIRSSGKAFSILSSGLYANKIQAVIRELSCNAVDSHVAAGTPEKPITVHLPNSFEPWFSVQDYGIGLNNDQVTNIYTTYFESTKTDSNDYIGALGLGSKSPFSYTDNFTVTAVKDGIKGVYSAFINEQGPSIALMSSSATDEANGIEVRLAVDNQHDFQKFREEAQYVFTYFVIHPNVIGDSSYKQTKIEYNTVDLLPGVNIRKSDYYNKMNGKSVAIMGNIAYPIDIPNAGSVLGDLANYLKENLDIRFNIGELDIQASREGLSYIPETIAAIKQKMTGIADVLDSKFAEKANAITNVWKQALALRAEASVNIWGGSVQRFVKTSKNPLLDPRLGLAGHRGLQNPSITIKVLAEKFNIVVNGFSRNYGNETFRPTNLSSGSVTDLHITFDITDTNTILINDLEKARGLKSRLNADENRSTVEKFHTIYEFHPADPNKPMLHEQLITDLYDYPWVMYASTLEKPAPKVKDVKTKITFMRLRQNSRYRRSGDDYVWSTVVEDIETFDKNVQYYFVELKGFNLQTKFCFTSFKKYYDFFLGGLAGGMPLIQNIIAVRGEAVNQLKALPNFKSLDEHIEQYILTHKDSILQAIILKNIDRNNIYSSDATRPVLAKIVTTLDVTSNFIKFWNEIELGINSAFYKYGSENTLRQMLGFVESGATKQIEDKRILIRTYMKQYSMINLLDRSTLSTYSNNVDAIKTLTDYIQLVDSQKGQI